MKTSLIAAMSLLVGAAIGAVATQGVNAQSKAKTYFISESEVVDSALVPAYEEKVSAAIKAAGGNLTLSRNIIPVLGDAPKRVGVTEFDTTEKARAWIDSAERKELAPQRDKAVKFVRQYIVESK